MRKKHILITGISGKISSALLKAYSTEDVEIIGIDKNINNSLTENFPNLKLYCFDLTDENKIKNFIKKIQKSNHIPTTVFFCAAIHAIDNDPFIDYKKFIDIINVNMISIVLLLSYLMPIVKEPTTFVFCSSGVIIFPNYNNIGYFISKLGTTRLFDIFSDRYTQYGFHFKSVILGPISSPMLDNSNTPKGIVNILRNLTTGDADKLAKKIIRFSDSSRKRMYYRKSSPVILWLARIVQFFLPRKWKFYRVISI